MEIIDQLYVVRNSQNGFATEAWPGPGYPVGWESATKFTDRKEAERLLKESEAKGFCGHVAVMEIRIKSRITIQSRKGEEVAA